MFISRGILSFDELLRKSLYRFVERIENRTNSLIHATYSQTYSQTHLYMPAYHHLFSYTLPFKNGGTDMLDVFFYLLDFYINSA